jgi:hypothetical protein
LSWRDQTINMQYRLFTTLWKCYSQKTFFYLLKGFRSVGHEKGKNSCRIVNFNQFWEINFSWFFWKKICLDYAFGVLPRTAEKRTDRKRGFLAFGRMLKWPKFADWDYTVKLAESRANEPAKKELQCSGENFHFF